MWITQVLESQFTKMKHGCKNEIWGYKALWSGLRFRIVLGIIGTIKNTVRMDLRD